VRKVNYAIWVALCSMILFGCGQSAGEEMPVTVPDITIAVFEPMGKEESILTNEGMGKTETSGIVLSGLKEMIEVTEPRDVALYNAMNDMYSNSLEENNQYFCVSPYSGTVYFVNQGKDYYLYRIKDGEVALAVELPVMCLCTYEDKVYFMLNSYEKYDLGTGQTGDIYCYTPSAGTVDLVYEMEEKKETKYHRMIVNEKGVYYQYSVMFEEIENGIVDRKRLVECFHLPFGASEAQKDDFKISSRGNEHYYVGWISDFETSKKKVALISREKGGEDVRFLPINKLHRYCVANNKMYYSALSDTRVWVIDLDSMEIEEYDFYDALKKTHTDYITLDEQIEKGGSDIVCSYAMTENGKYLWMVDLNTIYCMDTETKEVIAYEQTSMRNYETLYSDGENLYVAYRLGRSAVKVAMVHTEKLIEDPERKERFYYELEDLVK